MLVVERSVDQRDVPRLVEVPRERRAVAIEKQITYDVVRHGMEEIDQDAGEGTFDEGIEGCHLGNGFEAGCNTGIDKRNALRQLLASEMHVVGSFTVNSAGLVQKSRRDIVWKK